MAPGAAPAPQGGRTKGGQAIGREEASLVGDLREAVTDAYQHRELLVELTRRDLRVRYKQASMGLLWAVASPLVVVVAGTLFRYALGGPDLRQPATQDVAGLAVKSVLWAFFSGAIGFATPSLTANLPLVTKVYFPRELLPASAVLTQVVDTSVAALLIAVLLALFGVGSLAGAAWAAALAVLLVLFTLGASLLTSCANVYFRDARHAVQLLVSFGIFFTPVFYDLPMFGPSGVQALMLNPLTPLLEGSRLALVHGHDLRVALTSPSGALVWSPWYLAYAATWTLVSLAAGVLVFRRAEADFAELV
jgi:lipopolysaccharide transport system permease protein